MDNNSKQILNALTIDVEDYFMVSAFEPFIRKSDWEAHEQRAARSTRRVLDIMDEFQVKGTFFTLGWVAERFPDLMREIHQRGHEVACHGYDHQLIYNQTPEEFRQDVRKAKQILENASGAPVVGYRAPSFSVTQQTKWALDILKEEGFKYDASIFPAPHARGGMSGASRKPYRMDGLVEFPMSTVQFAGKTFGYSGGGYFRLLPYSFIRWGIRSNHQEGFPTVVYFHPWEFDPDQPKMPQAKGFNRFKHYVNLDRTEAKFRRLLGEFRFGTVQDSLKGMNGLNLQ